VCRRRNRNVERSKGEPEPDLVRHSARRLVLDPCVQTADGMGERVATEEVHQGLVEIEKDGAGHRGEGRGSSRPLDGQGNRGHGCEPEKTIPLRHRKEVLRPAGPVEIATPVGHRVEHEMRRHAQDEGRHGPSLRQTADQRPRQDVVRHKHGLTFPEFGPSAQPGPVFGGAVVASGLDGVVDRSPS